MNAIENSLPKLVDALRSDIESNDAKVLQPFIRKLDGLIEDYQVKVMDELHKDKDSLTDKIDDDPASTLIAEHIIRHPVSDLSGVALMAYGLLLLRDRLLNEYELAKGMKHKRPGKDTQ